MGAESPLRRGAHPRGIHRTHFRLPNEPGNLGQFILGSAEGLDVHRTRRVRRTGIHRALCDQPGKPVDGRVRFAEHQGHTIGFPAWTNHLRSVPAGRVGGLGLGWPVAEREETVGLGFARRVRRRACTGTQKTQCAADCRRVDGALRGDSGYSRQSGRFADLPFVRGRRKDPAGDHTRSTGTRRKVEMGRGRPGGSEGECRPAWREPAPARADRGGRERAAEPVARDHGDYHRPGQRGNPG